jgi:hypothetical protein
MDLFNLFCLVKAITRLATNITEGKVYLYASRTQLILTVCQFASAQTKLISTK